LFSGLLLLSALYYLLVMIFRGRSGCLFPDALRNFYGQTVI
jgi:hypothetical protein